MDKLIKRGIIAIAQVLLFCCFALAQGVPRTVPTPNPNLTAPGPHKQQPSGGLHPAPTGVVYGFVYWDAKATSHLPSSICSALAVTVVAANANGYTPFGVVGTQSHLTSIATVHPPLTSVTTTSYDGCAYSYGNAPLGQKLYVTLTLTQAVGTLTPATVAKNPPVGPVQFSNAPCSKLPPLTKATVGELIGTWGSCQNVAYDVNFPLVKTGQLTVLSSSGGSGGNQSGSQSGPLLNQIHPAGMLSNASPQNTGAGASPTKGMLVPAVTPAPPQTPSNSQPGTPGQLLPAKPGGGGTVQLNPQFYPPKGTTPIPGSTANNVQLNPQPFPPKGMSAAAPGSLQPAASAKQGAARPTIQVVKLSTPTALRKVTNPLLNQQNASIIAVLDQQKLAAQQDSTAMKSSAPSAATARTPLATNFQGNMPASGLAPSQTQSAPGNLSSSIAHLQPFNSVVLVCSMDTTPRVLRVNGGQTSGIFTPEAKYNQYTIVGCSFGQAQGTAHIFGTNGFNANLNIDYWSNNGITAHLDPSLAGVLDQNNVTLVVVPVGQQQIQKSGFKFYAARGMPLSDGTDQEVQLAYNSIPQASAAPSNISNLILGFDQLPSNAGSNFPSFTFQGTPVAGWVFRYGYGHCDRIASLRMADCYANGNVPCNGNACSQFFGVGAQGSYLVGTKWMPWPLKSDTWDFSKLTTGFQISDYQLFISALDPKTLCGAWDDMSHTGYFDPDWAFNLSSQNQITVTWAVNRCDDTEFGTRDNMAVQSAYGLAVWVMGPRCIDAWTGQKDQSCMAKVKQILG